MRLSDVISDRDNNFNLLRWISAWAVLVSHSFVIVTGDKDSEPLKAWLGITPGSIAVDIFFFTSGLLVTGSLARRHSVTGFAFARFMRIYPALIAMALGTVVILGLTSSNLGRSDFFLHPQTQTYIFKNTTLWWGVTGALPGVFTSNPLPSIVNASLWTLPFEIRMYAALAITWTLLVAVPGDRRRHFKWLVLSIFVASMALHLRVQFSENTVDERWRLTTVFFCGSACFEFRENIKLNTTFFVVAAITMAIATANKFAFYIIYPLALCYMTLFLAYIPRGLIRQFNRLGDYSYGTYIYAFPVQQLIASAWPNFSVAANITAATALTLLLAVVSWHTVEKPALNLLRR